MTISPAAATSDPQGTAVAMPDWVGLVGLAVLLACNAFFVGGEFAVMSARRSQIEPLAERGRPGAAAALWAMEHASTLLATTQLGITVCSLLILDVSEPAIHHLLAGPLALTGLDAGAIEVVAFVIALLVVSFLHVVLGEMVPKNLSFSFPDRAVVMLAPPLVGIARALRPITGVLGATSNGVVRLFGITPRNEAVSVYSLEEVETIVQHSTREGVLDDSAGTLSNAFEFSTKRAQELTVPLGQLVTLTRDATPEDVELAVARHGFSRYLIEDDGELIGYVHLKDVLELEDPAPAEGRAPAEGSAPVGGPAASGGFRAPIPASSIRRLVVVRDDADIEDVLALLRRAASHLARTVDASGATIGVVFLEDIIEELVGEVRDATSR